MRKMFYFNKIYGVDNFRNINKMNASQGNLSKNAFDLRHPLSFRRAIGGQRRLEGCQSKCLGHTGIQRPQRRPHRAAVVHSASAATVAGAAFPSGWPLWTTIAACAAISQVVERRTRVGVYLSAPLLATLLALGAAAAGLIPTTAGVYDTIWNYLMPISAALYLLEGDISELLSSAGHSIVAFFNGALGTVCGTILAFALVGRFMGADGAKVAAALCASYIGGSVNFAAVAGLLGLTSGSTLAAAMTSDNLAMAAYIAVLMSIPAQLPAALAAKNSEESSSAGAAVTSETLGLSLAAALLACALGNKIAAWVGLTTGGLAFTAVISAGLATLAGILKKHFFTAEKAANSGQVGQMAVGSPFAGAESLGAALMMFFFATIGAAAGSLSALRGSGWLLAFIAIQLSVQLSISLGLGKAMRIPMPIILIAANANVGGPATAAAMAGAKGWKALVQPAILTGVLGYVIANAVGWFMGTWLMTWTFA